MDTRDRSKQETEGNGHRNGAADRAGASAQQGTTATTTATGREGQRARGDERGGVAGFFQRAMDRLRGDRPRGERHRERDESSMRRGEMHATPAGSRNAPGGTWPGIGGSGSSGSAATSQPRREPSFGQYYGPPAGQLGGQRAPFAQPTQQGNAWGGAREREPRQYGEPARGGSANFAGAQHLGPTPRAGDPRWSTAVQRDETRYGQPQGGYGREEQRWQAMGGQQYGERSEQRYGGVGASHSDLGHGQRDARAWAGRGPSWGGGARSSDDGTDWRGEYRSDERREGWGGRTGGWREDPSRGWDARDDARRGEYDADRRVSERHEPRAYGRSGARGGYEAERRYGQPHGYEDGEEMSPYVRSSAEDQRGGRERNVNRAPGRDLHEQREPDQRYEGVLEGRGGERYDRGWESRDREARGYGARGDETRERGWTDERGWDRDRDRDRAGYSARSGEERDRGYDERWRDDEARRRGR